ncbi:hypothetical protein ABW19_dt0201445 [Dactylella cylindrospora]|nr:hypothetical protein ABW19_dt0201445 [Dactylella cylindrospora]
MEEAPNSPSLTGSVSPPDPSPTLGPETGPSERPPRIDCPYCLRSFYGLTAYLSHGIQPHSYSCLICTLTFVSVEDQENHQDGEGHTYEALGWDGPADPYVWGSDVGTKGTEGEEQEQEDDEDESEEDGYETEEDWKKNGREEESNNGHGSGSEVSWPSTAEVDSSSLSRMRVVEWIHRRDNDTSHKQVSNADHSESCEMSNIRKVPVIKKRKPPSLASLILALTSTPRPSLGASPLPSPVLSPLSETSEISDLDLNWNIYPDHPVSVPPPFIPFPPPQSTAMGSATGPFENPLAKGCITCFSQCIQRAGNACEMTFTTFAEMVKHLESGKCKSGIDRDAVNRAVVKWDVDRVITLAPLGEYDSKEENSERHSPEEDSSEEESSEESSDSDDPDEDGSEAGSTDPETSDVLLNIWRALGRSRGDLQRFIRSIPSVEHLQGCELASQENSEEERTPSTDTDFEQVDHEDDSVILVEAHTSSESSTSSGLEWVAIDAPWNGRDDWDSDSSGSLTPSATPPSDEDLDIAETVLPDGLSTGEEQPDEQPDEEHATMETDTSPPHPTYPPSLALVPLSPTLRELESRLWAELDLGFPAEVQWCCKFVCDTQRWFEEGYEMCMASEAYRGVEFYYPQFSNQKPLTGRVPMDRIKFKSFGELVDFLESGAATSLEGLNVYNRCTRYVQMLIRKWAREKEKSTE